MEDEEEQLTATRPNKLPRMEKNDDSEPTTTTTTPDIPRFDVSDPTFNGEAFETAFQAFQVVHLSSVVNSIHHSKNNKTSLSWKDLGTLFQNLNKEDQESWCIETSSSGKDNDDDDTSSSSSPPTPKEFLKPEPVLLTTRTTTSRQDTPQTTTASAAYCSFLVQKDKSTYSDFVQRLPLQQFSWNHWWYEPCIWIFFGRNPSSCYLSSSSSSSSSSPSSSKMTDLQGRPEHTDSISHDGTWHFQLSGTKKWILRPSGKLLDHMREYLSTTEFKKWTESSTTRVQVDCHAGDVIVVNTRLWQHQTMIPTQDIPSVSYARDFWIDEKKRNQHNAGSSSTMTNVDGLYATDDIEKGTVIFKESDMPDCELHRSRTNPNCEVVELEDGTSAIVSTCPIAAGDFFCVPESSDEEEDGEEEEEEYEDADVSDEEEDVEDNEDI